MKNRKYLKALGLGNSDFPEFGYTNYKSEDEYDSRLKKYLKKEEATGVNVMDCWNLDTSAMMWLYERLVVYKDRVKDSVDLSFHSFEIDGETKTQGECIDDMISIGELVIARPNNMNKHSATYQILKANKYYIEYNNLLNCPRVYNKKYQEYISGYGATEDYKEELNTKFWKIWAEIYGSMWW